MSKNPVKWGMTALGVLLLAGCAGSGAKGGMSDTEMIQEMLNNFKTSMEAKELEPVLAYFAEDLKTDQGMDKAMWTQFLTDAKEQGFLDEMKINIADAEITIEGTKAKVEPVEAQGSFGLITFAYELEKRDGKWLITHQTQQ